MSLLDQYQRERQRSRQRRQDNRGFQRDLQGGIQQLEAMRQQIAQEEAARKKSSLDEEMRRAENQRSESSALRDAERWGDRRLLEKQMLEGQVGQQQKFAGVGPYEGRGEMDIRLGKGRFELENILPKRAEGMELGNLTAQEQLEKLRDEMLQGKARLQTRRDVTNMLDEWSLLNEGKPLPGVLPDEFVPGLRSEGGRMVPDADFQAEYLPEARKAWADEVERRNALALENANKQSVIDKRDRPRGTGAKKVTNLWGSTEGEMKKLTKYGVPAYDEATFAARSGLGNRKTYASGGKGDAQRSRNIRKLVVMEQSINATERAKEALDNWMDADTGWLKEKIQNIKAMIGAENPKYARVSQLLKNSTDLLQRDRSGAAAPFQEALKIAMFAGSTEQDEDTLKNITLPDALAARKSEFLVLRKNDAADGVKMPMSKHDHFGRLLTDPVSIEFRRAEVGDEAVKKYLAEIIAAHGKPNSIDEKRAMTSAAIEMAWRATHGGL